MSDRPRLATLPLGALRSFASAARLGSFKAAATELSVTPAAISHQVKALEAHLGIQLFERLNRALRLTAAGQHLAKVAQEAFGDIEAGLAELEAQGLLGGRRSLTITAAPSFATKWLAPRLHRFQEAHPAIELRLLSGDALLDLTQAPAADVALRYGSGAYGPEIHAERLWPPTTELFPVCAPSLLARARLQQPADLLSLSLLRTASPGAPPTAAATRAGKTSRPVDGWALWFAAAGVPDADAAKAIARGPLFGSSQPALEAAAAGRGIALTPAILVADDLAAGRLVRPFALGVPDPYAFWLAYAVKRADESRIRAFARWVREEAAATHLS
jgi:DNA-binding transcriptional LysR family regulator